MKQKNKLKLKKARVEDGILYLGKTRYENINSIYLDIIKRSVYDKKVLVSHYNNNIDIIIRNLIIPLNNNTLNIRCINRSSLLSFNNSYTEVLLSTAIKYEKTIDGYTFISIAYNALNVDFIANTCNVFEKSYNNIEINMFITYLKFLNIKYKNNIVIDKNLYERFSNGAKSAMEKINNYIYIIKGAQYV